MNIAKVLTLIGQGIILVDKGARLLTAGNNIRKVCTDQNLTKKDIAIRVSLEALFILSQTGEIINMNGPNLKYKLATGTAEFVKHIYVKGILNMESLNIFLFRASVNVSSVIDDYPDMLCGHDEAAKWLADALNAGYIISCGRESILGLQQLFQNHNNRIPLAQNLPAPLPQNPPVPLPQNPPVPFRLNLQDTKLLIEELNVQINELSHLNLLKSIPDYINKMDPIFQQYVCAISGQRIRFVCSPVKREQRVVFYEESEIKNWIQTQPNQAPPDWPITPLPLPLKMEYITNNEGIQQSIDDRIIEYKEKITIYRDKLINSQRDILANDRI